MHLDGLDLSLARHDSERKARGLPAWHPRRNRRPESEVIRPGDRRAARQGHPGKRYVDLEDPHVREETYKAFQQYQNMVEPENDRNKQCAIRHVHSALSYSDAVKVFGKDRPLQTRYCDNSKVGHGENDVLDLPAGTEQPSTAQKLAIMLNYQKNYIGDN